MQAVKSDGVSITKYKHYLQCLLYINADVPELRSMFGLEPIARIRDELRQHLLTTLTWR